LHKRAFERELRLNAMQQLNLWKKELEEGVGKNGDSTREKRRGE
jgi:hypothetical protein